MIGALQMRKRDHVLRLIADCSAFVSVVVVVGNISFTFTCRVGHMRNDRFSLQATSEQSGCQDVCRRPTVAAVVSCARINNFC